MLLAFGVCAVCAASAALSSWDCFCCDCLSCTCCGIAGWLVTVFCDPHCSSFLLSFLGVCSVAFCHLGLLSHPILMFFLAWVSSFGVCRGLGLRCCGPVLRILPSFFLGGGGELSFPCLCCFSLAITTLFVFVQVTWFSWTFLLWVSFSRLPVFHW